MPAIRFYTLFLHWQSFSIVLAALAFHRMELLSSALKNCYTSFFSQTSPFVLWFSSAIKEEVTDFRGFLGA
jgi:hypothetical protein